MTEMIKGADIDELTGDSGEPAEPGRDAWFRRAVRMTLDKKAAGAMTYYSLDEVIVRFGSDARLS